MVELPASREYYFYNFGTPLDEASILIFGINDWNENYLVNQIIPPTLIIRLASTRLEDKSLISGYYSDLKVLDLGDIISKKDEEIEIDIYTIDKHIMEKDKKGVMIGGPHKYTYFRIKTIKPDGLILFDAHLDLKKPYSREVLSSETFMRKILLGNHVNKILYIGVRSYSRDEWELIKKYGDKIHILSLRSNNEYDRLRNFIDGCLSIYVSIDLDHLDPSQISSVSYPEPDGLNYKDTIKLLSILNNYKDKILGGDIMEFSPLNINVTDAIIASKLILEFISIIHP